MRIAVNVQTLVKDKMEGLGWFTFETLKRITKNNPEHEFVFIFGKGINKEFIFADNVKAVNIGPPFFRPMAWYMKFQFLLPFYINNNNFDLYLTTDGWSSPHIKTKTIAVIHDINFEHFPKFLPKSFYYYYKIFFKKWINHAKHIVTVSEYSKNDISQTYGIDSSKISVAYNGANNIYTPISTLEQDNIRLKYTDGKQYFIFVGSLNPRKNIINLFKAFDLFKVSDKQNIKLVIVGEKFYWDKKTNEVFNKLNFKNDVIFTGRLSQEYLKDLMASALALTYVSLFEGFGIPILEAMNSGIPVITSNTTSMPEVAGDAALIVNPHSINEISEAMNKLAENTELRNKLINAGNIRKLEFSWDNTANKLWRVIDNVLHNK